MGCNDKVDDAIGISCSCVDLLCGTLDFCIEIISRICLVSYVFYLVESRRVSKSVDGCGPIWIFGDGFYRVALEVLSPDTGVKV